MVAAEFAKTGATKNLPWWCGTHSALSSPRKIPTLLLTQWPSVLQRQNLGVDREFLRGWWLSATFRIFSLSYLKTTAVLRLSSGLLYGSFLGRFGGGMGCHPIHPGITPLIDYSNYTLFFSRKLGRETRRGIRREETETRQRRHKGVALFIPHTICPYLPNCVLVQGK